VYYGHPKDEGLAAKREIMLFIGKPKGRSMMIANVNDSMDAGGMAASDVAQAS